jgi:MFS family permease
LFADVSHETATAILPAFLSSLGASAATLGLIEGVADGASSFAKLASGAYSDRLRSRKPLAVVGYIVTAAGMASLALATSAWQVFAGRVVAWLGRGARSPVRKVLLASATTRETHGRAFGFDRAMDSAGAALGPALALVLLPRTGPRALFALTLVPGILAAACVALLVRETPRAATPKTPLLRSFGQWPPGFLRFLVGVGVAGLGDFSKTLLILFATQAWSARLGAARAVSTAMAYYVGYNVILIASSYASGALADRAPKAKVLAWGYAMAGLSGAALLWPGASFAKFAVAFAASALAGGVSETVESSSAAVYLPDSARGAGFGLLATVNGIGDVVSSAVVGVLWTNSPEAAMAFVIVLSAAGALIVGSTPAPPLTRMADGALPSGTSNP